MKEIPVKKKSAQSFDYVPLVEAGATAAEPQLMSSILPRVTHVSGHWKPVVVSFFLVIRWFIYV